MCGIVGYVGHREVVPLLIEGLKKLEYRGYDSAGVAVVADGAIAAVRAEGKLKNLREKLESEPLAGSYGLGHTRWATHGPPSERNAHPVVDAKRRVAVIHNGIIENFVDIKEDLQAAGWTFSTDTDTEVIANLLSSFLEEGDDLEAAVKRARARLDGMYAFAALTPESDGREIVLTRQGPPLLVGLGDGEHFLASDAAALLAYTRRVVFLENGDVARITDDGYELWDADGEHVERRVHTLDWNPMQVEKGGYKHFMLKEIHEQSQALQDTLGGRVDFARRRVVFGDFGLADEELAAVAQVHLLACGTSWHSALVAKFMIEALARVPVQVDYGSEYQYRDPIVGDHVLAVGISQSGETADTLASMEVAKERGARLLAICNVQGSQATRISDAVVLTHAGPEIGVASTKAFTTQLEALYLLALHLRRLKGLPLEASHFDALAGLPKAIAKTLESETLIKRMARRYQRAENFLYLGRGINYPIALEGALKLKEISYIHAEGYPAGEMKHGPIALIDEDLPVVAIATGDTVAEKVRGNMHEVRARDGQVIALVDEGGDDLDDLADEVIEVPRLPPLLQPIVNVVPLQLLAYHIGVRRGCDVDQPRNLAKSVTVE